MLDGMSAPPARVAAARRAAAAVLALGSGLGAIAAAPAQAGPAPQAQVTIRGSVGPGSTISVNVARVAPGAYRFVVSDQSTMHNWHITGPGGVSKKTGLAFTGTKRFTLTLAAGRYRIRCDAHPTTMVTHLRVRA